MRRKGPGAHGPTSLMHSVQQKAVSDPKLKEIADLVLVRQGYGFPYPVSTMGLSGQMTFCRSSFKGDLSGRRPFRWRKSSVSSHPARYMLIRNSYGSPGLSRTEAPPKGLWYGKDQFPVPNGQGRRLRCLRRLRYMRGTATAPCASGPAGCRADRGIWRWSGGPPRSRACPSR